MILESELGIGFLLEKKKDLMGKGGTKDSREKTVSYWEPGRVNQFKLEGRVLAYSRTPLLSGESEGGQGGW